MVWHRVVIKAGTEFENIEGAGLISNKGSYVPSWREAGMPAEAKVFQGKNIAGDHVFIFNPTASIIGKDVLGRFKAIPCTEPDLTGFQLLAF